MSTKTFDKSIVKQLHQTRERIKAKNLKNNYKTIQEVLKKLGIKEQNPNQKIESLSTNHDFIYTQ